MYSFIKKPLVLGAGLCLGLSSLFGASELETIMKERNLSEKDVLAAAKTYQPSGRKDEYIVFSSGGQSGQVIVYGVPSMRIYKYIGVFTPEPWQGYGYDSESKAVLKGGAIRGKEITWGDTHQWKRLSNSKLLWAIIYLSTIKQTQEQL